MASYIRPVYQLMKRLENASVTKRGFRKLEERIARLEKTVQEADLSRWTNGSDLLSRDISENEIILQRIEECDAKINRLIQPYDGILATLLSMCSPLFWIRKSIQLVRK